MRSALSLLLLLLAAVAGAQEVRLVVQSSPLAGWRYAEAAEVWPHLAVGAALDLVREADNPHDANAVRVQWRGRKLGYVPRRQNATIAWGLDRGAPLRARISRVSSHPTEHANPAKRLEFEVFLE